MQAQRLVSIPPLVSHPRVLVHNQRRNIQGLQSSAKVQSALTASDNEDIRFDALKFDLLLFLFHPLPVVRDVVSQSPGLLRVVVKRLQAGVNGVCPPGAPRGTNKPEHAVSTSPRSNGECEQSFNPFNVFPGVSDAGGLELEVVQNAEGGIGDSILEEGFDLIQI